MMMKKLTLLYSLALLSGLAAVSQVFPVYLNAQVAPAAFKSTISLTVGGTASAFYPDYVANLQGGAGVYVDLNLFHGVGLEAEGRWQRFNELYGVSQDNYLIGPRVKLKHIWRLRPYVKVLGGFSNMNFEDGVATGRFSTIAFGGGVDLHLTRRWSVRAFDAEYQIWPQFLGTTLSPYGASVGIGYRVF